MIAARNTLLGIMLLLLLAQSCNRAATLRVPAIERTTVCTISRNPEKFDGRRVSVSGCITTDGYERIVLSDRGLCTSGGLVPIESTVLPRAQQYSAKRDHRVCGVFTGTFRLRTAVYDRVLEVERTSNLQIVSDVGRSRAAVPSQ